MRQLFILLVGHNASGKTTVAKKLQNKLPLNLVEADPFRRFLKDEIPYFKDLDISIANPKAKIASTAAHKYRVHLSKELLIVGQSVIYGGGNLSQEWRKTTFDEVCPKNKNLLKVILYISIDEKMLLERLSLRDETPGTQWTKHYFKNRKTTLDIPSKDECDELLVYDQTNYEDIEKRLGLLLDKS